MSYSLTDYSTTEVELNDGTRSYYYKKCYCSVELQGEYIVFTSHKVENNAFRQQWSIAYTDFTTPTGSAATVLAAIKTIIENYASSGTGVTSVTATSPITSSGGATPNISTSMATNKLIGRSTAGIGVMEQISIGTGLSLSGGTLSNSLPFNTPITTKGDIYTRNGSADTRLPVGLDTQMLVADSSTTTGLKWSAQPAATPTGYYAMYEDVLTQTIAVINTGYPIKFRTLDLSNGVTVVSDSRITFANTGIYNLQFSIQLENSDTQEHDATIWLRLNGVDVPGSAGFVAVVAKHGGINGHVLPSWNYLLSVVAGQYYELVWSATSTQVTMPFIAAGSPPPSTASAIFTVTQQAGIMAGTGITAINSLTGSAQTLATNGSGTDFNVSSVGSTHTFNLPTASATNRGALSSANWTTFNNKQDALVSGTNIKTVNSNSLVGSGNISVGTVTGVTGTAPIVSSGGTAPAISMAAATSSVNGYLTSADWSTFNNKAVSALGYRKAGRWYNNGIFPPANAAFTNQINIRYVPIIIDSDITITRLGLNVVTAAAAGNTARIGIYSNDAATTQPLNLLVDSGTYGTLAIDGTGAKSVTGLSLSLTRGLYWMAYTASIASGTITGIGTNFMYDVKGQAAISGVGWAGFNQTFVYGALPSTAGTLADTGSTGTVCLFYYF